MIIRRVAVGNVNEAYIEDRFSEGVNILLSNDNNKGKTIVTQSMLYAIGNKPSFPASFNYRDYIYYIEFEHQGNEYIVVRSGDEYTVKCLDKITILDGMSELKRFWNNKIFKLPEIDFKGRMRVVDMELYVQLFFVGQDGKSTATIFNSGYYTKKDFLNMLLSYSGSMIPTGAIDEIQKTKVEIKELRAKRHEQLNLSKFYKQKSVAQEYLSSVKDKDAFNKCVQEIESITKSITEIKNERSRIAIKRSLWGETLKELNSLNRAIKVGELRCMDCNSRRIAFKGTEKSKCFFDVSTPKMREQIINSVLEKISDYSDRINAADVEIQKMQERLYSLMDNEDVTIENVIAYKENYKSVKEIEREIKDLDKLIEQREIILNEKKKEAENAKQEREKFHRKFVDLMNEKRKFIDAENKQEYTDIFTKQGAVVSGSEETVFFVSKLLASAIMTCHDCPIIMDSFRAEDLSTDKEKRVLQLFKELKNQSILTTTLKREEVGKYNEQIELNVIDYSSHVTNRVLNKQYTGEFIKLLLGANINMLSQDVGL